MSDAVAISMCPDDFVQGGLIQDVDVTVTEAVWQVYDYAGKAVMRAEAPLALKLTLTPVGSEDAHDEYVTAGSSHDFLPNPDTDSDTVMAAGSATQLRKGSNYELFSKSLLEAGFPKETLRKGSAKLLVGLVFHLERRARPKMQGIDTSEDKREKQYLHCSKIITLPGEKAKGQAKAKPGAGGTAKAAASAHTELDVDGIKMLAIEKAAEALNANGNSLAMNKLKIILMPALKDLDTAQKQAVNKLVGDAAWLAENGFTVTDGLVSV